MSDGERPGPSWTETVTAIAVIALVVTVVGVASGAGAENTGPSADIALSQANGTDAACNFEADIEVGSADRVVLETAYDGQAFQHSQWLIQHVQKGSTMRIYAIEFGGENGQDEITTLHEGYVTNRCSLGEVAG